MLEPKHPKNDPAINWVGPDDWGFDIAGLVHNIRLPKEATLSNPAPVAVLVHGRWGDESVMWIFKQVIPPDVAIVTPRAPLPDPQEQGHIWFHRTGKSYRPQPDKLPADLAKLVNFIEGLAELYPVDPDRLLLLGFSQGAAISNLVMRTRPELLIGTVALSGFMPDVPDTIPTVDSLAGRPVFVGHGVRDDVVPIEAGRHTRDVYAALQADFTYNEYDVKHKMNQRGLDDVKKWTYRVFDKH